MFKKALLFLPLLVLLGVCVLLFNGLRQDPKQLASALIDKPVPEFYQADLRDSNQIRSPKDFPKRPFLLNVWGSWCVYCQQEHALLLEIAKEMPIVGLNYRDKARNAQAMLVQKGDPFLWNVDDSRGELAMKLGVDGAPETYLIDGNGVIRYRHSGLLDRQTWQQILLPKIKELSQ